jgi:hypothetical protein
MWEQRPPSDVRRRELALAGLALVTMTVDAFASLALIRLGLLNGFQGWTRLSLLLLSAALLPIATLGFGVWGWRANSVRPLAAVLSIVVALCGLGVIGITGLLWLVIRLSG